MKREELLKLKEEKSQMEAKIKVILEEQNKNFAALGQQYFNNMEEGQIPDCLTDYVEKVRSVNKTIEEIQNQMAAVDKAMEEPIDNNCPKCGKLMDTDARFCSSCGSPLDVPAEIENQTCKNCNNVLKPGARFCGKCGTPA